MNKKTRMIALAFLFSALVLGRPILPAFQKKDQEKKKTTTEADVKAPMGGGAEGETSNTAQGAAAKAGQGGVVGGSRGWNAVDNDFLLEPIQIISFNIEHLLIKPTETVSLSVMTDWQTINGIPIDYTYPSLPARAKDDVGVEITPTILQGKGIELKISVLHNGKAVKEEKVLAANLVPVIVELLENAADRLKIADKITPMIRIINPLRKYPFPLPGLEMSGAILVMNETLLVNNARGGSVRANEGSESDPIFLWFWAKDKGLYVLSPWPFKGAEPIGAVSGNVIRIRQGDDFFACYSTKPILPEGKWRIWVRCNPDYKPAAAEKSFFQNKSLIGVAAGKRTLENFFPKGR